MLKNSVEVDKMDEKERMLKVAEKVKELQAMAKKKKNVLEYREE